VKVEEPDHFSKPCTSLDQSEYFELLDWQMRS